MADAVTAREAAQKALYDAITQAIPATTSLHTPLRARALADLAAAYRYLSGGPQPGGVYIDGK